MPRHWVGSGGAGFAFRQSASLWFWFLLLKMYMYVHVSEGMYVFACTRGRQKKVPDLLKPDLDREL